MKIERIMLTTGGTGGHIFPALAVAEEVRRRVSSAEIVFMGSSTGPEAELAAQAGLEFAALPVRGVFGRGLRAVSALAGMGLALLRAAAILRKARPHIVVGFGGYAGFAGVFAAQLMGMPTAVHEQNSIAGMSNRILARRADRVCTSLPMTAKLRTRMEAVCTGNPVRAAIARLADSGPRTPGAAGRRVLIMGGSQGSRAINMAVCAILPLLLDAGIRLWHQTGAADLENVREAYHKAGADAMRVEPFVTDMAGAYAWADLAVCRAGATSLAELAAAGVPALFIPFPQATHDHQTHNARQMALAGAAAYIAQPDIQEPHGDPVVLARSMLALAGDPETLCSMSAAARSLARPDAAARLVDELERVVASRRRG